MSDTLREIQKYHDGRYRSVDAVYLCSEIGNPDKERLFVPFDKVLEIIDDEITSWEQIRDELGCKPEDDNAEAALAIARSRIKEELKH